jgi:uncharacterized membrane protein YdfJ with MMPL/SSD domain
MDTIIQTGLKVYYFYWNVEGGQAYATRYFVTGIVLTVLAHILIARIGRLEKRTNKNLIFELFIGVFLWPVLILIIFIPPIAVLFLGVYVKFLRLFEPNQIKSQTAKNGGDSDE